MAKKMKILHIMETPFEPACGYDFTEEMKHPDWAGDRRIIKTLRAMGHDVHLLGLHNRIERLLEEIKTYKPDLIFNSADSFKHKSHFDKNIAGLIEMLEIPYTGASSTSLMLCNNKAVSKKIFNYHRIRIASFQTFYKERKIKLLKKIKLPCIVKPLGQEASRGISLASVVDNEAALIERVKFIHESMQLDAIVEEYIEGREFYVSLMGHNRLKAFPLREMTFGKMPEDEPRIATYKAKWDKNYREKWKINNVPAHNLPDEWVRKAQSICKRAYRALNIRSYARFDIRITVDGLVYIIEANANPSLLPGDEFVLSAKRAGISFEQLITKMIKLALDRGA